MIKTHILLPEGRDVTDVIRGIEKDLSDYAFNDVNDALRASGYMSGDGRSAKVYIMTVTVELEEVK